MLTNENKKCILNSFLDNIFNIGDVEYQKKAWIKGEEADFDEAVCIFFDLGDPILEEYKDYGISESQYQLLNQFRNEFDAFVMGSEDLPEEFINTPEWEKIIRMAREVLKGFNYQRKA